VRVIRDRDEARWLPSRHHFALAKLIAMIVMKPASRAESSIKLIYAIDRDQSMVENYAVAMWLYVTGAAYLMAATHPAAWILMPWLAGFLIHAPCFLIGWIAGLFDAEDNRKLNGVLTMGMMLIASSYFATTTSPVRFIAWFFLSIMALNAIAAVVMWMLRGTAAAMERRCEA
jgi:ABC-type multidrug transport system fused ATPase/permease subunit